MKDFDATILSIGVVLLSILFGSLAGNMKVNQIRHEAIEREYGQYCPNDGVWRWKGECE